MKRLLFATMLMGILISLPSCSDMIITPTTPGDCITVSNAENC